MATIFGTIIDGSSRRQPAKRASAREQTPEKKVTRKEVLRKRRNSILHFQTISLQGMGTGGIQRASRDSCSDYL